MSISLRGKMYLLFSLVAIGYGVWIDNFLLGFIGGVFLSWSYWYWWRNIIWRKQLDKLKKE